MPSSFSALLARKDLLLALVALLAGLLGARAQPHKPGDSPTKPAHNLKFEQRAYPIDSLRLLSSYPGVPDTLRVFYLSRLAVAVGDSSLPQALQYGKSALALAKRIGYVRGELNCTRSLGIFYSSTGDNVAALRYYQAGVDLATAKGMKTHLAKFYDCMGGDAATEGDIQRSLKYLLLSLSVLKELNPEINKNSAGDFVYAYNNIGNAYFKSGDKVRAAHYAQLGLGIVRKYPSERSGKLLMLAGRIYEEKSPRTPATLDSADFYLHAGLDCATAKGDMNSKSDILLGLAELYEVEHRYPDMLAAANRSLVLARKIGDQPTAQEAYSTIALAYSALGDYRKAYQYLAQATDLNKTLLNTEKNKALAQLQVRYDVREQEQKIQLLTQRNIASAALAREQERRQWGLLGISGILALGLATGGLLHLRLKRSQRDLAHANGDLAAANSTISHAVEEKEVLLQEIHHRVKNNLQLISSLLGWQRDNIQDPEMAELMAGNQARIQSMALVHEFLYHADNLVQVRLDSYLTELLNSLHSSLAAPHKKITLSTDLEPVLMDAKEAAYFGLLVNELVTNAYKHAFNEQPTGNLHIALVRKESGFQLSVSDNGQGLPATGFTSKSKSIGIHLVKTLTKQLKATIAVLPQPVGTRLQVVRA